MARETSWPGRWWARIRALDQEMAEQALARFERAYGLDLKARPVRGGGRDAVRRALTPEGRPLIEHHWATWCEPCEDELPRIERLARRLAGVADVVGISWDRFQTDVPDLDGTVRHVAQVAEGYGLTWPTLVFDGTHEVLAATVAPAASTVPHTRVLDADGGVLRVFDGPLRDADVDAVVAMLT